MRNSLSRLHPIVGVSVLTLVITAFGGVTVALAGGTHTGGHGEEFKFGKPGKSYQVSRTVDVIATDMDFEPSSIMVEEGATIRFVVHNRGQVLHEFNIGTPSMHEVHQEEMQAMMEHGVLTLTGKTDGAKEKQQGSHGHHNDMAMVHDDPNSILLEPGETRELIWTFDEAQSLQFACNVPGHYEAGMHSRIQIE